MILGVNRWAVVLNLQLYAWNLAKDHLEEAWVCYACSTLLAIMRV